jgi:predicted HAD superfamily Cof-like phosphohydrolase
MSNDWVKDINNMHVHYGVHDKMKNLSPEMLREYVTFRLNFIQEELNEAFAAVESGDPEEIVDACVDMCVVAIGTLDLYDVDAYQAWDEVLKANMNKKVGIKASRPNKYGLPDLIKPENWQGPDHTGNHGKLTEAFSD